MRLSSKQKFKLTAGVILTLQVLYALPWIGGFPTNGNKAALIIGIWLLVAITTVPRRYLRILPGYRERTVVNTTQETGKRIVSRSAYVRAQGKRLGLGVSGAGLLTSAMISALGILFFGCGAVFTIFYLREPFSVVVPVLCLTLFCMFLTYYLWRAGVWSVRRANQIDPGVPVTRANAADLPALDTLVRASCEPPQEQQKVLLRMSAAQEASTPTEQLVRPSAESE